MIIKDLRELRKYVKVNANLPFDTIAPYLKSATDVVLADYLGEELISELSADFSADTHQRYRNLRDKVSAALAPLALMLGMGELSVRMSDAGFTVEKKDNLFVPASDTKLEILKHDLQFRGMSELAVAIRFLQRYESFFDSWQSAPYYQRQGGQFLRSEREYQEIGMVHIDYNVFIFDEMIPLLQLIEDRYLSERIPFLTALRGEIDTTKDPVRLHLIRLIRRFTAMKSAELYTSQLSQEGSSHHRHQEVDFGRITRPLFGHSQPTNFYADNAEHYLLLIDQLLDKYTDELGLDRTDKRLDWNREDRGMFVDIG